MSILVLAKYEGPNLSTYVLAQHRGSNLNDHTEDLK